jgi:hypothetical protein
MGTVGGVQLAENVGYMILDCTLGQEERGADVPIASALGEQGQHLTLALGQVVSLAARGGLRGPCPPPKFNQQLARHIGLDERLARVDAADYIDQFAGRDVLE